MIDLKLGGRPGYFLLKAASVPPSPEGNGGAEEETGAAKLEADLGREVWKYVKDRTVVDFGCGFGHEAVAAALHGATRVYGLEINDDFIGAAQREAEMSSVADHCFFLHGERQAKEVEALNGTVDTVFSLDAFEHFRDPGQILTHINKLLKPGGRLLVNFGPPWNHPYGAHARYFTRIPWVHLIFSEKTILKVRALYRDDGATRFEEVRGGLNRMTVGRFLSLIKAHDFEVELLQLRPVKGTGWFVTNNLLKEYFTSAVICAAVKKASTGSRIEQSTVRTVNN
jgi:SAM-dependent methyltransferase